MFKLTRETTLRFNNIFDQYIPPLIRDSKLINRFVFKLLYGKNADIFLNFKTKVFGLSDKSYDVIYKKIQKNYIKRNTNLNQKCVLQIVNSLVGSSVLDVGCGDCYLAGKIPAKFKVVACDIIINNKLKSIYPQIKFVRARVEKIPFKNRSFDTVICTHTLEHVLDINTAIKELRRVTRKRLIIVVPKQRPYMYTFDLHLHFFPYISSFLTLMGSKRRSVCKDVDGDLFYLEDM